MTPTTALTGYDHRSHFIDVTPSEFDDVLASVFIGPHRQVEWAGYNAPIVHAGNGVAWNGHQFEVVRLHAEFREEKTRIYLLVEDEPHEFRMQMYFPVDPRTTVTDWDGAIDAVANSDNDGWLPIPCHNQYMTDREIELRSGIVAAFQPEIDELSVHVIIGLGTESHQRPLGIPWESNQTRRTKLQFLIDFRNKVIECAVAEARERHIGWYHQNPDKSHLHGIIKGCVETVRDKPGESWTTISSNIRDVLSSLQTHEYETRWDRDSRLKKEAAAKAAAEAEGSGE